AAPQVDRALPGPQANPVDQRTANGGQLIGLPLQPGTLTLAASQRVDLAGVLAASHACSRTSGLRHTNHLLALHRCRDHDNVPAVNASAKFWHKTATENISGRRADSHQPEAANTETFPAKTAPCH